MSSGKWHPFCPGGRWVMPRKSTWPDHKMAEILRTNNNFYCMICGCDVRGQKDNSTLLSLGLMLFWTHIVNNDGSTTNTEKNKIPNMSKYMINKNKHHTGKYWYMKSNRWKNKCVTPEAPDAPCYHLTTCSPRLRRRYQCLKRHFKPIVVNTSL